MGIFRDHYSVYQKERDGRGERQEKGVWWWGEEWSGERRGEGWKAGRNTCLVSFLEEWTSSS